MHAHTPTESPSSLDSIPWQSSSLRTFCDIIAAGVVTVIAGIGFIGNLDSLWLTLCAGLSLIGGLVLLFSRASVVRLVAMASHTLAIVVIATMTTHASWDHNLPDSTIQVVLLLMLFPATMLLLLTLDHYIVANTARPVSPKRTSLKRRFQRAGFLVAAALMLMTCVYAVVGLAGPLTTQLQSHYWERLEATIVQCELIPSDSSGAEVERVEVQYEFDVEGERRIGTRLNAIPSSFFHYGKRRSEDLAKALTPGTQVQVAYNPAHPDDALLFPGVTGEIVLLLLALCFYPCLFWVMFDFLSPRDHAWLAGVPVGSSLHEYFAYNGNPITFAATFGAMLFGVSSHIAAGVTFALTSGDPSISDGIITWLVCFAICGLIGWHIYGKAAKEQSSHACLRGTA